MAEGKIKKLTDKGFGFIDTGNGEDLFFHHSGLVGAAFDDLRRLRAFDGVEFAQTPPARYADWLK